jgi:hypothetical protein
MKVLAEVLAICVLGSLAFTANSHAAQTKVTDPRKCSSTPAYCASHAAGRAAIAKVKTTQRPVAPLQAHCDQTGTTLLKWRCRLNDSGGHGWNVSVIYRATSVGWRVRATVLSRS